MERLASTRYRWEENTLDSKAAKQEAKSTAPGAEYLMLRQRVAQAMDTTGWGTILVMIDVILSVLSVIIYIAMTYHNLNVLYHIDLALACIFTLNWVFWFWVAEDRLRYIFSFLTLVDVVTICPSFVLYGLGATVAETVPGLNFLRVLRILRVLRVFRMKHIMRRHLEGAVVEAAGKLVFSLLSIVFIAAGLFYELEKYGPSDDEKKTDNLQFHQSIYWATVTLTTVGYGDIVPTYWATQVMLIGLLMLTFTLLPYLTGQLMDALSSTSTYQRRSFKPSRRGDVSHVIITGFLDGATMQGVLDELYHEDKGFNHNHAVLLSERPPSHDVEHVLATHNASRKLTYLQGSPFRPEDFRRAGAEYASAIFIIAPKYPEDPTTADRYLSMCALSLGQYLQEVHVSMEERLSHTPNRVMHYINHGTVLPPEHLPDVYLQVCLPQGRLRLFQVLQSLQDKHPCKPKRTARSAAAAADSMDAWQKQQQSTAAAAAARADADDDDTALAADNAAAAGECDSLNEMSHSAEPASRVSSGPDAAACSDAYQGASNGDTAVDLSAHQDASAAAASKAGQQQQPRRKGWLSWCCAPPSNSNPLRPLPDLTTGTAFWQEYSGSIHVLCLSEIKYAMMAQSAVGVPGAITLLCNLSTTVDFGVSSAEEMEALPPWLRDYMVGASQEVYQIRAFPGTLVGRSVKEAAGFVFDSCHAVLLAVERTKGLQRHRMIVGDLEETITADMHGYIVADDVSSVLLISAAQEGDFELWHKLRQQHLMEQLAGTPSQQAKRKPHKGGSAGKAAGMQQSWKGALQSSSSLQLPEGPQQRHRLLPQRRSEPGAVQGVTAGSRHGTAPDSSIARQPGAASEPGTYQDHSSHHHHHHHHQQQQQQQVPAAWSSATTTGDKSVGGSSDGPGSSHSVAAVLAACSAVGVMTRRVAAGHASALGALIHLLRSPSRVMRKRGEAFLRQHYHMRPPGTVQWDKWVDPDMSVDLSELSGHILVLGLPASQDGLLSLLAVLRSKRLLQWRPVVIIDSSEPSGGGSWEAVAQFCDTYFIKAGAGLNDALLRASAERAAQAILMTPLVSHDYEDEDQRLASKVMTDAVVVNRYQLLKGINPSIDLVTEMMMPQSVSFLSSTTPVRGVDHRYLHLLSPAYISGSVFHARLLDDLMIASYCNGASDRLVLQLLHRWHMGWAGAQAFSTLAKEQQEVLPGQQQTPQQQQQDAQGQQQQQQQQQQQEEAGAVGTPLAQSAAAAATGGTYPAQQQQQQEQVQSAHLESAVSAVFDKLSQATSMKVAPGASVELAKRAAEQWGVPVLMQIVAECPPGTTYGRYFHLLLHSRGLLLLGVHRLVMQDGLTFRATITNPSYHSEMQPDDHAFVVARPPLPADCNDRAAVAAAWPPDTLGFSNLDPQPPLQQDLWVPAAAAAAAAEGPVDDSAGAGGAGGAATLHSLADADAPSGYAQQAPHSSYTRSASLSTNSASDYDAAPAGTQRTDSGFLSVLTAGCGGAGAGWGV